MNAKLMLPKLIAMTVLSGFISSSVFAATPTEALYESRAELESAQANRDDAQAGLDMSADDLYLAKDNHAALTSEAKESARRIREEIARLEKQQKQNVKETQKLSTQIASLKKQARNNEAQEKQLNKKSAQMDAKMEKVRNAWAKAKDAEQRSHEALKRAQASYQKSLIKNKKEHQRLSGETRRSLARVAANRKKIEALRAKKIQNEQPTLGRVGLN
ncbi:hypothetical protein [Bdellovibrio sp. HCB2-146]|uniref:hypothetical protein n=1 Tax=Bdellovibrio sp. HCB2-146 TaxID=3394362 RepID=UPI0039BC2C12